MSAIAAIIGAGPAGAEDDVLVRQMLQRAAIRGSDVVAVWRSPLAVLAVARHGWELGADFAGGVTLVEEDGLVVVADASLYYLRELDAALTAAGAPPRGPSASHHLLAAYRAWGLGCLERLEGDFAFLLWDERAGRLLAARDFHGTRPLFHAVAGGRLLVASTLEAVAGVAGVSRRLNLVSIAEDLASLSSIAPDETAFAEVQRLPAGWVLQATADNIRSHPFWRPPVFEQWDGTSTEDASARLRHTLAAAVRERLACEGPTAVWLSGGYDSTAVLASGHYAGGNLMAVSMSYPEGDPGREDEQIALVAGHCDTPVHWVQSESIAPLGDPAEWGRRRDEPAAHAFASWNEALAHATIGQRARVALNGNGGDQFFGVSPVFLADLLRSGGWLRLISEARALGIASPRAVMAWAALPTLSERTARLVGRLRGNRAPRHYLQEQLPGWLREDFVRSSGLAGRRRPRSFRRPGESHAAAESAWYLQGSFGPRVIAHAAGLVLAAGAEARSPLYDGRVIALAARRPREERCAAGEKKRLLRRSMRGLLPDAVLAPRPRRTGLPRAWLQRWMLASLPSMVASLSEQCALADIGLVEPRRIQDDWSRFAANPRWEAERGGGVFHAMAAEYWLRDHAGSLAGQATALVA